MIDYKTIAQDLSIAQDSVISRNNKMNLTNFDLLHSVFKRLFVQDVSFESKLMHYLEDDEAHGILYLLLSKKSLFIYKYINGEITSKIIKLGFINTISEKYDQNVRSFELLDANDKVVVGFNMIGGEMNKLDDFINSVRKNIFY